MPKPLTEISSKEFSMRFGALIGGLFVFYLLLFGNFTGDLLNCQIQARVKQSPYIRHIIGFFVLYFFVNLASPNVNWNAGIKFGFSIALYLIFLISNRSEDFIVLTNVALLAMVYILQMVRDTDQSIIDDENSTEEEKQNASEELERIKIVQLVVAGIIGILIILGFILYVGRRKLEFGEQFSYSKLLFETSGTCGNDIPMKTDFKQQFKAAFKPAVTNKISENRVEANSGLHSVKLGEGELRVKQREMVSLLESPTMQNYMERYINAKTTKTPWILTPTLESLQQTQAGKGKRLQPSKNSGSSLRSSSRLLPETDASSMENVPLEDPTGFWASPTAGARQKQEQPYAIMTPFATESGTETSKLGLLERIKRVFSSSSQSTTETNV